MFSIPGAPYVENNCTSTGICLRFKKVEKDGGPKDCSNFLFVIFISLDLVEDCSIAGYEEEEYGGDTRLPYGVQRTRTPDSLVSRYPEPLVFIQRPLTVYNV
jgi:hypothetical protein